MDDDLSLVVLADAKDRMEKAVGHTQTEFGGVRTGRATSGLVEHLRVDIYGAEVELRQVAGLSVPEARMLVISPYDKSTLAAIEKAIQASDLGITPSNDGNVIRLAFPPLTEETAEGSGEGRPPQGGGGPGRHPEPPSGGASRARGART